MKAKKVQKMKKPQNEIQNDMCDGDHLKKTTMIAREGGGEGQVRIQLYDNVIKTTTRKIRQEGRKKDNVPCGAVSSQHSRKSFATQ